MNLWVNVNHITLNCLRFMCHAYSQLQVLEEIVHTRMKKLKLISEWLADGNDYDQMMLTNCSILNSKLYR